MRLPTACEWAGGSTTCAGAIRIVLNIDRAKLSRSKHLLHVRHHEPPVHFDVNLRGETMSWLVIGVGDPD
jgi:hypothetical protein